MPSVWADSEEVEFTDEIPVEPSHVYELLMGAVSEQGRAIIKFEVDGKDALSEGEFPSSYEKIEATTLSHDELTLRLVLESVKQFANTEEHLQAYLNNILTIGWSEVFKRMDEFIQKVQPFADLLDNLGPYVGTYDPAWRADFEKIASRQSETLGGILQAFEQGNPALLSDELAVNFIPVFRSAMKLLRETAIPFLQQKVSAEKKEMLS